MPVAASPLFSLRTAESIALRVLSSSLYESALPSDDSSANFAVCCDSTWICVVSATAWRSSPFFTLSCQKSSAAKPIATSNRTMSAVFPRSLPTPPVVLMFTSSVYFTGSARQHGRGRILDLPSWSFRPLAAPDLLHATAAGSGRGLAEIGRPHQPAHVEYRHLLLPL